MIKKIYISMIPFIFYSIIIFLLMILSMIIPKASDIVWLWGFLFYLPYLYGGIYIISFILGLCVQKRSNVKKIKNQLILSIIFFLITLSNLLIPAWKSITNYSLQSNLIYTVYPALGSAILFFIAQIIKLHNQRKSAVK